MGISKNRHSGNRHSGEGRNPVQEKFPLRSKDNPQKIAFNKTAGFRPSPE